MNIKKLRIFHEVYVTGSITKAAERSFVSQPAASKMLSGFEDEIGYKLFVRKNGQLSPTDEALYLYEEVFSLLQNMDRLEDSIKGAAHRKAGRLNIGSTFGPAYNFLPQLISKYMEKNPGIKVSLHLMSSKVIRDSVATGQYQIGLVDRSSPSARYDSLEMDLVCYCAIHCAHPAAHHPRLSPKELDDTPWISLTPGHATTKSLKKAYADHDASYNPVVEVHTTLQALSFVNLGTGVALIDSLSYADLSNVFKLPNIKVIPFDPVILEPAEVISSNIRPLPAMVTEFYDILIRELEVFRQ